MPVIQHMLPPLTVIAEELGGMQEAAIHHMGASQMVLVVKNLPAMQEIWVRPLGWRKERLPTPVFWPGEFHGLVHGVAKSWTQLSDLHFHFTF